jgi:hypothetical protein
MDPLEVWNEDAAIRVSRDAHLSIRMLAGADWTLSLQEGRVDAPDTPPVEGLQYYALPCVFECLDVRLEGAPSPIVSRAVGGWPRAINDDELEIYPHLHFLEERKTGKPWRFERWYTLAGAFLVYDSEQYFERSEVGQESKSWQRLIVHMRQVVDLALMSATTGGNLVAPYPVGDRQLGGLG